jgi:hypothetical protein
VVGLSVFGVYQPLFFALTLFLIGRKATLFFFVIALLATIITRSITHYIHLLQSAKISLLVCWYMLLLLVGFRIDERLALELLGKSLRTTSAIILPMLIFLMVNDKLFTDSFKITQKSARIALVEFAFLTGISRRMLNNQWLRTILLSYPEMIIAILLASIIVGRFTGLQLFELIRFMPLIQKYAEDEEE